MSRWSEVTALFCLNDPTLSNADMRAWLAQTNPPAGSEGRLGDHLDDCWLVAADSADAEYGAEFYVSRNLRDFGTAADLATVEAWYGRIVAARQPIRAGYVAMNTNNGAPVLTIWFWRSELDEWCSRVCRAPDALLALLLKPELQAR